MAAPAETKREAISVKFSIDGPNTGIFPKAAGSRILCPPGRNERPADKSAIGQCVKRSQFADTVEQKNSDVIGNNGIIRRPGGLRLRRPRNRQSRPPDELAVRFVNKLRGLIKALRLAGRKHKQRLRILALQSSKGNERVRLFRRDKRFLRR